MKIVITMSLAALLSCASLAATAATFMYQYIDSQGSRVFSYTLPPGQAKHGYEKVNLSTGKVETVAPQLSAEEMVVKQRQDQAMAACQVELQRIYTLYGSERDIHHARTAALDALSKHSAQIEANQQQAEVELERLQSQAADAERAGRPVAADLVTAIERRDVQLVSLERQLALRHQEQDLAEQRYRRELDRFRDGRCPEPELEVLTQVAAPGPDEPG